MLQKYLMRHNPSKKVKYLLEILYLFILIINILHKIFSLYFNNISNKVLHKICMKYLI